MSQNEEMDVNGLQTYFPQDPQTAPYTHNRPTPTLTLTQPSQTQTQTGTSTQRQRPHHQNFDFEWLREDDSQLSQSTPTFNSTPTSPRLASNTQRYFPHNQTSQSQTQMQTQTQPQSMNGQTPRNLNMSPTNMLTISPYPLTSKDKFKTLNKTLSNTCINLNLFRSWKRFIISN